MLIGLQVSYEFWGKHLDLLDDELDVLYERRNAVTCQYRGSRGVT